MLEMKNLVLKLISIKEEGHLSAIYGHMFQMSAILE